MLCPVACAGAVSRSAARQASNPDQRLRAHPSTTNPTIRTQAGLGRLLDGEVKPPTRKEEAWRFTDLGKLYGKRHVAPPQVRFGGCGWDWLGCWGLGVVGWWWICAKTGGQHHPY